MKVVKMQTFARMWLQHCSCLLLVLFISPAQYAVAQDDSEEQSGGVLEEITVTARRYEENIADVPVSVNVMTADYLEAAGLSNVRT